jgi:hypothetical protein
MLVDYYCLFLRFNRTGEKCRTGSAWKFVGERVRRGAGVRNDPNNVCTCELMNKKKESKSPHVTFYCIYHFIIIY